MSTGKKIERKWRVSTDLGMVEVGADSEAQARSRARYKAVHARFYGRAAEMARRVRECETYGCKEIGGAE